MDAAPRFIVSRRHSAHPAVTLYVEEEMEAGHRCLWTTARSSALHLPLAEAERIVGWWNVGPDATRFAARIEDAIPPPTQEAA
jgi:hypothetical protein